MFDPENDIPKKQKVIDEFKNNKDKRQLVIILGVLNHWTSVIISKDPVLNDYLNINITNKQFYFYFLDSLNVEIFKCTNDEEISCYVKNLNEEKIEIGKKAMTEFEIKCFNIWFKDITLVLSLLDKLLTTSYSLEEYFIEKNIEGFVNYIVKEKLNWNTKEDCMNLYNLIKDKINPLVVRDETLGLADFFNFDGKKIRIFNSELYNKCINCFDSCQNLKKNYLKFKSELLDEEDWYLNEFFDLINSLNKYLKRNN